MTRGRCGSLLLQRKALSSSSFCRFIPAHYPFTGAQLVNTRTGTIVDALAETCQPNDVLWSPHGKYVMRLGCTGYTYPTLLTVFEAQTGHLAATIESNGIVTFSDDERRLAGLDGQGNASLWDLPGGARSLFVPGIGRRSSL